MKAAVNTRYGGPEVVQVREVPTPEPGPGQCLVKVHASTVSRTDCGWRRGHPFFIRLMSGVLRPKQTILGMDFAGEVQTVGQGNTAFKPGDRVFGLTPGDHGGHAEYLILGQGASAATIPEGLPFEQAVVCEGALYAAANLRALGLGRGHHMLIYGASGAIGTAALQLGKAYGAHVTAVVSARHVELAKALGADRVIDYTAEDFTKIGQTFDVVFDAVGKLSYFRCRHLLKSKGRFASTDLGPWGQNLLLITGFKLVGSRRFQFPIPAASNVFVESLKDRMQAGEFRAVVDRQYPLDQIVEAYRYVDTGHKTGIVVLRVA